MKTVLCFLCLSLLGWVPLCLGLVRSRRYRRKAAAETARAEGVVTGYEVREKPGGRGRMYKAYYPIVTFTVESRVYTSTSEHYYVDPLLESDAVRPAEGNRVILFYNPANPFKFHLEDEKNDMGKGLIRIGAYIIAFAAVVTCVVSVLVW